MSLKASRVDAKFAHPRYEIRFLSLRNRSHPRIWEAKLRNYRIQEEYNQPVPYLFQASRFRIRKSKFSKTSAFRLKIRDR